MQRTRQLLPLTGFIISTVFLAMLYGMWAWEHSAPPAGVVAKALETWRSVTRDDDAALITTSVNRNRAEARINMSLMQPGLTLVTIKDKVLRAMVIEPDGSEVQRWDIDWHELWPDARHLSEKQLPKRRPGTHIHGASVLPDGDLVFNFEFLGMVRLDPCGNVKWRLPYRTHHSIYVDSTGTIWASGQIHHDGRSKEFPRYSGPFIDPSIVKISPDGELLEEKSVMTLLRDNGLNGVLYNQGAMQQTTWDTLHLNDVEVYEGPATDGFFTPGDVMISLRNMSVVVVFDSKWKLKYYLSGYFSQQHDPDFIDANTLSIFDNNPQGLPPRQRSSRILIHHVADARPTVYFAGSNEEPFFTRMMGKHQWLENGNLLIAESGNGRALEVTPKQQVVWEYLTPIPRKRPLLIEQAERLDVRYDKAFFAASKQRCKAG